MIISVKHIYRQALVFVLMLACVLTGHAQLLQKTTKAGRPSMMFGSVIADADSFIISGVSTNPVPPYYARSVFGKLDNSGSVVHMAFLYDSLPKDYGTFLNCLIPKLSGGYAYTGYTYDSVPKALLVTINNSLVISTQEYDSFNLYSFQGMRIIEDEDGYYITGIIRPNDITGYHDIVIIKVNSNGNRLWQKKYGTLPNAETPTSLTKLNNGNLMIGSFRNNLVMGNEKANTWLLEVDTAGEIVRQWFDPNDSTYGAYGLRQTTDGGFYYASQKKYEQTVTDVRPIGAIVRMDNQFNKLWQYEGDRDSPYTGLFDIEQLADGSFIACGSRHVYGNIPSIVSAWVVKVSSTGQEIWSREYSGSTAQSTKNFLNDIDILPNGNLVAVGETRNGSEGQFGLLLVLDSNGCVIENCTVGIDDIESNQSLKVYPNPATDRLIIEVPEYSTLGKVYITSITGESVEELAVPKGVTGVELNTGSYPAGVYMARLGTVMQKFIIVR